MNANTIIPKEKVDPEAPAGVDVVGGLVDVWSLPQSHFVIVLQFSVLQKQIEECSWKREKKLAWFTNPDFLKCTHSFLIIINARFTRIWGTSSAISCDSIVLNNLEDANLSGWTLFGLAQIIRIFTLSIITVNADSTLQSRIYCALTLIISIAIWFITVTDVSTFLTQKVNETFTIWNKIGRTSCSDICMQVSPLGGISSHLLETDNPPPSDSENNRLWNRV